MRYGAPFIGSFATRDPIAIRDYVQSVEEMGFEYLFMDEVLLNDNPQEIFHESLTLFAYLSALTSRLKFVTGVMILPKRSTLLLARQAAEVDVLSAGRLRLGVGVGWSQREFQALGVDFRSRGRLIEEQITLLRRLWTESRVSFKGEYHTLDEIGINLLPVQRPIPIWMGGGADIVLRRTARLADGWVAYMASAEEFQDCVDRLHGYLRDNGRQPDSFKIANYLHIGDTPQADWEPLLQTWRQLGVTHTIVLPPTTGRTDAQRLNEALMALRRFSEAIIS